jgi:ribosomal protein S18 acetylase RimI-like enzyme
LPCLEHTRVSSCAGFFPSRHEPKDPTKPVTHFRTYRNGDSPRLAALWNQGVAGSCVAGPLTPHEFDKHVVGGPLFESAGFIVAEREGRVVGFAHAGFGPQEGNGPLRLSYEIGTIGMLVLEPAADVPEVEAGLLEEAERYLRSRGASVVYAGGQIPLNPFYWGVYGGSEWAGILAGHARFHRAVARAGFEPVSTTVLLEVSLARPEAFDPRGILIKRQVRISVEEDALPNTWWQALAIGEFRPTIHRLVAKTDAAELARATTWDMGWFGRRDGRNRVGLIEMEVTPSHRRKGYGRHLVTEILRFARAQSNDAVAVQTRSTNTEALALYHGLGFEPVESATLYRKPGGRPS